LEVGLHPHDRYILDSLDKHFNYAGEINDSTEYPHWYIRGIDACYSHVLPFFDAHPPLTIKKSKEYALFREAVIIAHNKQHLTAKGSARIREIKEELNRTVKKEKKP